MTDKIEAVRAVVEAARAWRTNPAGLVALADAVDALEEVATVRYEDMPHTAWHEVREGDLVRTPKGEWLEVLASVMGATAATQRMTFRMNGDAAGPFDRPAESRVDVRRPRDEMNEAIDLFAAAFDIRIIDPEQVSS